MQRQDPVDVDRGHDVAVEDHQRVGDALGRKTHRPARPERRRLDDITDAHAGAAAVAEDLFNTPRLEVEAENDFVNLRDLLQQVDLIVEKGAIENGNDGLGRVYRQRPEPRALAPCKQNRLHVNRTILPQTLM